MAEGIENIRGRVQASIEDDSTPLSQEAARNLLRHLEAVREGKLDMQGLGIVMVQGLTDLIAAIHSLEQTVNELRNPR